MQIWKNKSIRAKIRLFEPEDPDLSDNVSHFAWFVVACVLPGDFGSSGDINRAHRPYFLHPTMTFVHHHLKQPTRRSSGAAV